MKLCQECANGYFIQDGYDNAMTRDDCQSCEKKRPCFDIPPSMLTQREPDDDDDNFDETVAVSPSMGGASKAKPAPAVATESYLYFEKRNKQFHHYQFSGKPSPGDLQRIASGRLRVFCFHGSEFMQVEDDGREVPVGGFQANGGV